MTPDRARRPGQATAAAADHTFDLAAELPLRAELLAIAPDEHVLVLVLHHIASDGWSMAPLLRDLAAAYAARAAGRRPTWTPLPVQYADYALWQHDLLGATTTRTAWPPGSSRTGGTRWPALPDQLELPTDRPAAGRAEPPRRHRAAPPRRRRCTGACSSWPARSGATLFMVLQAALPRC